MSVGEVRGAEDAKQRLRVLTRTMAHVRACSDKTDFCRCLEVVINEVRGIKQRPSRPASLGPEMLQVPPLPLSRCLSCP